MSSTGTELTRTTVGSVTNQYKWTYSFWVKRSALGTGATNSFIFDWYQSSANRGGILFENDNTFKIYDRVSNSNALDRRTNRKFMDINGWFHFVIAHDRTLSSPLTKIYVNGVEETSFQSSTDPSQNGTSYFNTTSQTERIGKYGNGNEYSQMIMTHVHFCDGYYYQASDFGSVDNVTGEWKLNTSPSVTYGNNGYFILKDGNSLTDQSPNTNNFTVASGTLTQTKDCPDNVFCNLNSESMNSGTTLSKGNLQVDYNNSQQNGKGTIGFSSGKFYWEIKASAVNNNYPMIGIGDMDREQMTEPNQTGYPGGFSNSYGIYGNGNVYANGSNTGSQSFSYTTNDIIGVAVDLDSGTKTIKWFKNGSQIATYNITNTAFFTAMDYSGGSSDQLQYNFGNGYFGTTAVSSNSGNGYSAAGSLGIFQHQPPTNYTALCTKGLNL